MTTTPATEIGVHGVIEGDGRGGGTAGQLPPAHPRHEQPGRPCSRRSPNRTRTALPEIVAGTGTIHGRMKPAIDAITQDPAGAIYQQSE
jgi:hypothetical protein